jgi:hypothetical protein
LIVEFWWFDCLVKKKGSLLLGSPSVAPLQVEPTGDRRRSYHQLRLANKSQQVLRECNHWKHKEDTLAKISREVTMSAVTLGLNDPGSWASFAELPKESFSLERRIYSYLTATRRVCKKRTKCSGLTDMVKQLQNISARQQKEKESRLSIEQ